MKKEKTLDEVMAHLQLRWMAKKVSDKKLRVWIRRSLWLGANVPHFVAAGVPEYIVLPVYKKMPERFHLARAQAVMLKHKKEQDHEN